MQANGLALQHLPPHLRADREVVLLAVRRNGLSLAHASSELRADTEVALTLTLTLTLTLGGAR